MTIRIEQTDWAAHKAELSAIRHRVFIEEQHVPKELEWDEHDEHAIHLLAYVDEQPVATLRMLSDGHIGRMAVLKEFRRSGIGTTLMQTIMSIAQEAGLQEVHLDAQIRAIPFYQRLDFTAEGDEFMDAGIPHRHMFKRL